MPDMAFVVPLVSGKGEAWRAAMQQLSGDRKADYEASRRALGIHRESCWLQSLPTGEDVAVVYVEADDLDAAVRGMGTSDQPFDVWFRELVQDAHGLDFGQGGVPPPELMLDYRRGEGVEISPPEPS